MNYNEKNIHLLYERFFGESTIDRDQIISEHIVFDHKLKQLDEGVFDNVKKYMGVIQDTYNKVQKLIKNSKASKEKWTEIAQKIVERAKKESKTLNKKGLKEAKYIKASAMILEKQLNFSMLANVYNITEEEVINFKIKNDIIEQDLNEGVLDWIKRKGVDERYEETINQLYPQFHEYKQKNTDNSWTKDDFKSIVKSVVLGVLLSFAIPGFSSWLGKLFTDSGIDTSLIDNIVQDTQDQIQDIEGDVGGQQDPGGDIGGGGGPVPGAQFGADNLLDKFDGLKQSYESKGLTLELDTKKGIMNVSDANSEAIKKIKLPGFKEFLEYHKEQGHSGPGTNIMLTKNDYISFLGNQPEQFQNAQEFEKLLDRFTTDTTEGGMSGTEGSVGGQSGSEGSIGGQEETTTTDTEDTNTNDTDEEEPQQDDNIPQDTGEFDIDNINSVEDIENLSDEQFKNNRKDILKKFFAGHDKITNPYHLGNIPEFQGKNGLINLIELAQKYNSGEIDFPYLKEKYKGSASIVRDILTSFKGLNESKQYKGKLLNEEIATTIASVVAINLVKLFYKKYMSKWPVFKDFEKFKDAPRVRDKHAYMITNTTELENFLNNSDLKNNQNVINYIQHLYDQKKQIIADYLNNLKDKKKIQNAFAAAKKAGYNPQNNTQ